MQQFVQTNTKIGSRVKLYSDDMIYEVIGFTNDNRYVMKSNLSKDNNNLSICELENIEKIMHDIYTCNLPEQEIQEILMSTHGG
jgi:hypothetical protein